MSLRSVRRRCIPNGVLPPLFRGFTRQEYVSAAAEAVRLSQHCGIPAHLPTFERAPAELPQVREHLVTAHRGDTLLQRLGRAALVGWLGNATIDPSDKAFEPFSIELDGATPFLAVEAMAVLCDSWRWHTPPAMSRGWGRDVLANHSRTEEHPLALIHDWIAHSDHWEHYVEFAREAQYLYVREKLDELTCQISDILEWGGYVELASLATSFRYRAVCGAGAPIRVICLANGSRPNEWCDKSTRQVEWAAFNQLRIEAILWGQGLRLGESADQLDCFALIRDTLH